MATQSKTKATTVTPDVKGDGVYNLYTGMGDARRDSTVSTFFVNELPLRQYELESVYRFCGIGRRIVEIVPAEATRQWVTFPGDTDQLMIKEMQRLNFKREFRKFLETDRLHGGAILLIGANDGGTLEDPLNEAGIKEIEFLRVYDRWQVTFTIADYYLDPSLKNYGTPERYYVTPCNGLAPFYVHESRMMVLKGVDVPDRLLYDQQGWGDSVLQSCREDLAGYEEMGKYARHLMKNYRQNIMKISGLIAMLGGNSDMTDRLTKRINLLDMTGGFLNTMLVDAEHEDMTQLQADVSGIPLLMFEFNKRLSASTGIPPSILLGQSPTGLNASGKSEIDIFEAVIKAYQTDNLEPLVNRMARLLMAQKRGPWRGKIDKNLVAEWQPLSQMGEMEEAALRLAVAQTDQIYIGNGVLDPSEVAVSRFGGEQYSTETVLDTVSRKEDPERFEQAITNEATPPQAEGGPGE